MNLPKLVISLVLAGSLSACIQLPEIDQPRTDAGTQPDASTEPGPTLDLLLNEQRTTLYAKASVAVRVETTVDITGPIDLLEGETVILSLQPPYNTTWDTSSLTEGTYSVRARAQPGTTPIFSGPITLVVDRTAPRVIVREPAPGDMGVSVNHTIRAEFSEPLASATVTDNAVRLLKNGTDLTKTLSLSQDGKALTIAPSAPFTSPANLSVTLSSDITDLAGNGLSIPTNAWTWSAPEWLMLAHAMSATGGANPAHSVSLRLNSAGQPIISWAETDTRVRQLTSTGWQDIGGPLNASPGDTPTRSPSMVLNAQDRPVVAWEESDGLTANIHVREWTGSQWQPVGSLLSANPGSTSATSPSLQLKNGLTPVVAWSESDGSAQNIYVSQMTDQGWQSFGTFLSTSTGMTDAKAPKLELDTFGYPVVAWLESDGTAVNLYVRRWVGSAWQSVSTPLSAYSGNTDVYGFDMTLNASGNPIVVWSENDGTGHEQVHARQLLNNYWSTLGGSLNAGRLSRYINGISVRLDSKSRILVAWSEYDADGTYVDMYLSQWANKWQSLSVPPTDSGPGGPFLAFDSADIPFLAWSDHAEFSPQSIYVGRLNP